MRKNGKKITASLLAFAMLTSIAMINASAYGQQASDGTYAPDGSTPTRRVFFAMPGCWESEYWRNNSSSVGVFWQFGIDWPGYKMVKDNSETNVNNVYSSLLPYGDGNASEVTFNNYVDGLTPSMPDYSKERFDAAKQTNDATNSYYNIGDSDYYSKQIWMYVYDKLADFMYYPAIDWDAPDNPDFSKSERAQIQPLISQVFSEFSGYTNDEFMAEFEIPEFGKYSKNFFFDFEDQSGMALGFGDMMYVCNLDPNSLTASYTIAPEGKTSFGGEYFFYYGNGEYGTWPTKKLLLEKTGISFNADGTPIAPEGMEVDGYGNVVRTIPNVDGNDINCMVYGTVNGKYATNKQMPVDPTSDPSQPGDIFDNDEKQSGNYFYQELDDGTIGISGYMGNEKNIVFPEKLDGKVVSCIGIGSDVIDSEVVDNVVSISIPDTVHRIGNNALRYLPNLERVDFSNNVTYIGDDAFCGCTKLKDIPINTANSNITYVGSSAFFRTDWLDSQAEGVVYIDSVAYTYKGVVPEHIDIKQGTKVISPRAFASSNFSGLKSVSIPKTVTQINDRACGYIFSMADGTKKTDGFIIYGEKDTAAEEYAKENGFIFQTLDEMTVVGDLDGDGVLAASDRVYLARHLAKWKGYDHINQSEADVNRDGSVNTKDRIILTRHLANWKGYETLPVNNI